MIPAGVGSASNPEASNLTLESMSLTLLILYGSSDLPWGSSLLCFSSCRPMSDRVLMDPSAELVLMICACHIPLSKTQKSTCTSGKRHAKDLTCTA